MRLHLAYAWGVPDPDALCALGPAKLNLWAAYLDLYPPSHVVSESLMIRHAGAMIAAQAGSSEQVHDLLRTRESIAAGAPARRDGETPIVPVDPKVIAFAKAQAKRGGKRRG